MPARPLRHLVAALLVGALPALANVVDPSVIDFVVRESGRDEVYLDIVQHLPWTRDTMNLLDRKIDAYLKYFRSGGLLHAYPDLAGKPVVIRVVYTIPPDAAALWSLQAMKARIAPRGLGMTWVALTPPNDAQGESLPGQAAGANAGVTR
ncbi:MAG TPA: DUF6572 domain-containing protein [Casimicrobiaceae bacterium]|nr:DUF6572 domain-containing protein [Casimicrobiaceae bacterium]